MGSLRSLRRNHAETVIIPKPTDEELIEAVHLGTIKQAKALLEQGANPNAVGKDSTPALHYAACNGKFQECQRDHSLALGHSFSKTTADNIFLSEGHFRPVLVLSPASLNEPGDASLRHRIEPLSRLDGINLLHRVCGENRDVEIFPGAIRRLRRRQNSSPTLYCPSEQYPGRESY